MARKFKDAKGREWTIALSIGRAREVLERTGINLLEPESGSPSLPEVLADEFKVATLLEVMLSEEFKRIGVDPKNVMDTDWDGATTLAAYNAFLEELAYFFEARGQAPRAMIIRKATQAIAAAMEVVGERVARLEPAAEVRRLAAEADARADGSTSGRPQGVPVSTPSL